MRIIPGLRCDLKIRLKKRYIWTDEVRNWNFTVSATGLELLVFSADFMPKQKSNLKPVYQHNNTM